MNDIERTPHAFRRHPDMHSTRLVCECGRYESHHVHRDQPRPTWQPTARFVPVVRKDGER